MRYYCIRQKSTGLYLNYIYFGKPHRKNSRIEQVKGAIRYRPYFSPRISYMDIHDINYLVERTLLCATSEGIGALDFNDLELTSYSLVEVPVNIKLNNIKDRIEKNKVIEKLSS